MANNPKHKENLKPFKPGKDDRRHMSGRPRKWVSLLKAQGYKKSEINDAIEILLQMTEEELIEVQTRDDSTILEKTVAKGLTTSLKAGSLDSLETILSRAFGKPNQYTEVEMRETKVPEWLKQKPDGSTI